MGEEKLQALLQAVASGVTTPEHGVEQLRHRPFENLGGTQFEVGTVDSFVGIVSPSSQGV